MRGGQGTQKIIILDWEGLHITLYGRERRYTKILSTESHIRAGNGSEERRELLT